jgi:cytochrome b561
MHPERLLWLGGALAAGGLMAVYGLRRTQFEATPQGLFYTPHAHLGIALSLLLVGRILYRLVEVYYLGSTAPSGTSDFARSPATLAVFGILAGYYIAYAAGLLRWRYRVIRAKAPEAKASSEAG